MTNIEKFISLFDGDERYLNGLCYWFAHILDTRFPGGDIWYDPVMNHFYYVFDDVAYDVRGRVVLPNISIKWDDYYAYDALDYQRVVKYCILKEDN